MGLAGIYEEKQYHIGEDRIAIFIPDTRKFWEKWLNLEWWMYGSI